MLKQRLVLGLLSILCAAGCSQSSGSWKQQPRLPNGLVSALWSTWDGTLLVGIEGQGLFYLDKAKGAWEGVSIPDVYPIKDHSDFMGTTFDAEHRLVFVVTVRVGWQAYRVDRSKDGHLTAELIGDLLHQDIRGSFAYAKDGTLVAAGGDVLARLPPGASSAWITEPLPAEHRGSDVARARDGEIYIQSTSKGLHRLVLGSPVSFVQAFDCKAATHDCNNPFNGTTLNGEGDLLTVDEQTSILRLQVATSRVDRVFNCEDQFVQGIFPTTESSVIYVNTGANDQERRIYRVNNGDATLVVPEIWFDRMSHVTRNGTVCEISPRPTYLNNEIRCLE